MLVLSRAKNERIFIGDEIVVTFCGLRNKLARIGIEAPAGVRIDREEVSRRIAAGEPLQRIRDDLDYRENRARNCVGQEHSATEPEYEVDPGAGAEPAIDEDIDHKEAQ